MMSRLRSQGMSVVMGILACLMIAPDSRANTYCQTDLDEQLKALTQAADNLHVAYVNRGDARIQLALDQLTLQTECTIHLSRSLKRHERQHLVTGLNGVRDGALRARDLNGSARDEQAQDVFRQFAHLSRIHRLPGPYQVFFCGKDRAFWLQASNRIAVNPIHPAQKCAVRITN